MGRVLLGSMAPLEVGKYAVLKYPDAGEEVYHERFITGIKGSWVASVTPDGDHYGEDTTDLEMCEPLSRAGSVPEGVDGTLIYRFDQALSTSEKRRLLREGEEVLKRDVPEVVAGKDKEGAVADLKETLEAPPGFAWVRWQDAGTTNFGQDIQVDGVARAAVLSDFAVVELKSGEIVMGHLVQVSEKKTLLSAERAKRQGGVASGSLASMKAAISNFHLGEEEMLDATKGVAVESELDSRLLPIMRDAAGERFRQPSEAVFAQRVIEYKDWPISGPRTAEWTFKDIVKGGGTPINSFVRWRTDRLMVAKAGDVQAFLNSELVGEMGFLHQFLEVSLTYDQLSLVNTAGGELIARRIQQIRNAFDSQPGARPKLEHTDLILATSASAQGGMAPDFSEYVAEHLKRAQKLKKERRLLGEEEAAEKNPGKGGGNNGNNKKKE